MKFKIFNSADSYGFVSKNFHWILAAIIIFNFILALILDDFPKGPMRSFLFGIHKSTGILVIILLIPRLLWRLVNTVPDSLGNIKTLNKLSKYAHYLFYFILLVVAFSGWIYSSARSGPFEVFGLFTAPALIENNPVVANISKEIHEISVYIFVTVLGIHIVASLLHHYVFKDKTLKRMWYGDSN
jgi:cytochrome b561